MAYPGNEKPKLSSRGEEETPKVTVPAEPLGKTMALEETSPKEVAVGEPSTPSPTSAPPPLTKTKFPKKLLAVVILIFILGALSLVAAKLITKKPGLVGKKGEIVWWGLQLEENEVAPLIEEYERQNPDVKITYIKQSPEDYRVRLANALVRGEGPDIFRIHNSWVPMFKQELDVLPSSIMSQQEYSGTFYPVIVSDMMTDLGIVGIPLGYDAITLYVNDDIFASAAKVPPKFWDELRGLAKELTQVRGRREIIQSGVALGITENVDHWQEILGLMMFQNNVDLTKPSGQLAENALEFFSVFFAKDKVWDETLPSSTVAFANGQVAMYFGPAWRANEISRLNPKLRFKTVALPQIRKEDPGQPDVSYATYWVEAVWGRSRNKEEAWKFLKFMASPESLEKLYNNATQTKLVGEPYPRQDMGIMLREHPIVGSVMNLATQAKSWYLADATYDGPTGINSQINALFAEALNLSVAPPKALEKIAPGVAQVLAQYGIRAR